MDRDYGYLAHFPYDLLYFGHILRHCHSELIQTALKYVYLDSVSTYPAGFGALNGRDFPLESGPTGI